MDSLAGCGLEADEVRESFISIKKLSSGAERRLEEGAITARTLRSDEGLRWHCGKMPNRRAEVTVERDKILKSRMNHHSLAFSQRPWRVDAVFLYKAILASDS